MVTSLQQVPSTTAQQQLSWQSNRIQGGDRARVLKHIIVISDAIELTEEIQTELSYEGYQVSVIHDGLRGLMAVKRFSPDLIIVDWNPPRLSGISICKRLRLHDREKPIILLTSENAVQERIEGFEAGANDCISPPFVKAEFVARINAKLALRQVSNDSAAILRCADIVLNRETREVFRGGVSIQLTAKEFSLLEFLMDHYCQVLTRTQILEDVWDYDYTGNSNTIEVYIRYLRNKLGDTDKKRLIHTVRGVGYMLREQCS
ncbi:Transcriptional regulatory C terminal domain protein [Synechococcus sp. PCC 7335]|uniref:response regulator transcription factor n=1 Tax=Synechococcus sp. (strain ATCC 29403 / PCC 7335) TaxID=91464 RepID=UPI00017EB506|nr:response regulator transcription factor [Synechococcus sp. PCC 7335]EDX86565.1 Transcriptional regulatory C terminal domain protein [Synechococcus sp. PCC 7335]